jgi:hypothetical protein
MKIIIFDEGFLKYIQMFSDELRDSYHKNSWQVIIRTPSFVKQFLCMWDKQV